MFGKMDWECKTVRRQIAICIIASVILLAACGAEAKEKKVADDAELVDITGVEQLTEADEAVEETVEVDVAEEPDGQVENGKETGIKTETEEQKVTEEVKGEQATKVEEEELKSSEQKEVTTKKPTQKKTLTKPSAQPNNPDAGCVDNSSDILTY